MHPNSPRPRAAKCMLRKAITDHFGESTVFGEAVQPQTDVGQHAQVAISQARLYWQLSSEALQAGLASSPQLAT